MPTLIAAPATITVTTLEHADGGRVSTKRRVIPTGNIHHFSARDNGKAVVHFREDLGAPYSLRLMESLEDVTTLLVAALQAVTAPAEGWRALMPDEVGKLQKNDNVTVLRLGLPSDVPVTELGAVVQTLQGNDGEVIVSTAQGTYLFDETGRSCDGSPSAILVRRATV